MHNRIRIIVPVLLLLAIGGGAFWWWNNRTATASAANGLSGSGTIEAEQVLITAEVAGRVKELAVDEGQEVAVGTTLATLDSQLLQGQRSQADAALQVAAANVALLKAGSRAEDIAVAQAQLVQVQAARDGAADALTNAQASLEKPQDLQIQVAQARANRDTAQRALQKLRAGSRPEDIAVAQAALDQTQANQQASSDRLSAAKTNAATQLQQANAALTQAQARYAQAKGYWERAKDSGVDPVVPEVTDPRTGTKSDNRLSDGQRENYYSQMVQAEAALHQAEQAVQQALVSAEAARQAEVSGVQQAQDQTAAAQASLLKMRNGATRDDLAVAETALANAQNLFNLTSAAAADPIRLRAAADAARSQLAAAEAQVSAAQARLAMTKSGTRPEQLAVAEAQRQQAQAARDQIDIQLAKTTLTAPRAGLILNRALHEGEQASPGSAVMTIGALETVQLTIYIAENQIGQVTQGQTAQVTVNSFPGRVFNGQVTHIADQAQFTPRNVQTSQERATTVFAVRIDIPNADHALKPGMPADAVLVSK